MVPPAQPYLNLEPAWPEVTPREALIRTLRDQLPIIPPALRESAAGALLDDLLSRGFIIIARGGKRIPPRGQKNRNPAHLAWVRTLHCCVPWCISRPPCEAAHVRLNTGGGMGKKPPDRFTVPLCRDHHREQHQIGHRAFDEKHGIELRKLAEEFAAASPHLK